MSEVNLKRTTIMADEEMLYKIDLIARREGEIKSGRYSGSLGRLCHGC